MTMIKKLFIFTIAKDYTSIFHQELQLLKEKTLNYERPIAYNFIKKGEMYIIVEIWATQEDYRSHINSDHLKYFRKKRADLVLSKEEYDL